MTKWSSRWKAIIGQVGGVVNSATRVRSPIHADLSEVCAIPSSIGRFHSQVLEPMVAVPVPGHHPGRGWAEAMAVFRVILPATEGEHLDRLPHHGQLAQRRGDQFVPLPTGLGNKRQESIPEAMSSSGGD